MGNTGDLKEIGEGLEWTIRQRIHQRQVTKFARQH